MGKMSEDEVRTFMRFGSRTGKLATVRPDGSPHVVPVWFDFDDANGDLIFLTRTQSVKAANIRAEPRISLAVDEEVSPFAFARLDGEATLTDVEDDPGAALYWSTLTCRRYVGDDRADEFGRRNAVPGESVVRVRPTRLMGETGVAD
jgi:PPOX class probable F420-dependent enzyme